MLAGYRTGDNQRRHTLDYLPAILVCVCVAPGDRLCHLLEPGGTSVTDTLTNRMVQSLTPRPKPLERYSNFQLLDRKMNFAIVVLG